MNIEGSKRVAHLLPVAAGHVAEQRLFFGKQLGKKIFGKIEGPVEGNFGQHLGVHVIAAVGELAGAPAGAEGKGAHDQGKCEARRPDESCA